MTAILNWLDAVLSPFLPADIYMKLDQLYNGTIICLGRRHHPDAAGCGVHDSGCAPQ